MNAEPLLQKEDRSSSHTYIVMLIVSALILAGLLFSGCSFFNTNESETEHLTGSYVAVEFKEPGSHDGGVDILANGGKLLVHLLDNWKVNGEILIPEGIDSNYAPKDTIFSGGYAVEQDSLWFKNTETPLDNISPFIITDLLLESKDIPGRGAGFKIVLERQSL